MTPSQSAALLPNSASEHLARALKPLTYAPAAEVYLPASTYQQILDYCGIRPSLPVWRQFLLGALTLLGFMALVVGLLFFIAWNWAAMPKMAKFGLVEVWIIALAVLVWWRWYQRVAQVALLAIGLSLGGLLALYGQIYQTGADSWELFRAWALILLPLALLGRQNALWCLAWVVAHLAFQLYYGEQALILLNDLLWLDAPWQDQGVWYGYLAVQLLLLVAHELLTHYTRGKAGWQWLAQRWPVWLMAAYWLFNVTPWVMGANILAGITASGYLLLAIWALTLLAGYFYYRYRRPDLCMLTLGMVSVVAVGCMLILRLFNFSIELGGLFGIFGLLAFWLAACGSVLLHWWRAMYSRGVIAEVETNQFVDLVNELQQQQLINAQQAVALQQYDHAAHLPWYLRVTLAIGGWLAASIILGLLLLTLFAFDITQSASSVMLIIYSLILAVPAALLLRKSSIGKRHIGLAWALAATYGLGLGIYLVTDSYSDDAAMLIALCFLPILAIMVWVMADAIYRFLAVGMSVFLLIWPLSYFTAFYLPPIAAMVLMVLVVALLQILWLGQLAQQASWGPGTGAQISAALLYGLPTGLMLLSLNDTQGITEPDLWRDSVWLGLSSATLGTGIAVGTVIAALVQAIRFRSAATDLYLPAAIVCAAVALFSAGMGLGLLLILVTRYLGSRVLLAIASAYLLLYLLNWYYFLGTSLLHKSLLLVASGVLLLILALVVKKWQPQVTGGNYANPAN